LSSADVAPAAAVRDVPELLDVLLKIVSTLTVVRAARRAGVASSPVTPLPDWRIAGRVLSYRPEEALPDVLQEGMKMLGSAQPGAAATRWRAPRLPSPIWSSRRMTV